MIKKYKSFEEAEKDLEFSPKTLKELEKLYQIFEAYEKFFKIKPKIKKQEKRIRFFKTFESAIKEEE